MRAPRSRATAGAPRPPRLVDTAWPLRGSQPPSATGLSRSSRGRAGPAPAGGAAADRDRPPRPPDRRPSSSRFTNHRQHADRHPGPIELLPVRRQRHRPCVWAALTTDPPEGKGRAGRPARRPQRVPWRPRRRSRPRWRWPIAPGEQRTCRRRAGLVRTASARVVAYVGAWEVGRRSECRSGSSTHARHPVRETGARARRDNEEGAMTAKTSTSSAPRSPTPPRASPGLAGPGRAAGHRPARVGAAALGPAHRHELRDPAALLGAAATRSSDHPGLPGHQGGRPSRSHQQRHGRAHDRGQDHGRNGRGDAASPGTRSARGGPRRPVVRGPGDRQRRRHTRS